MKFLVLFSVFAFSSQGFAAGLEAVDCKREMIAAALAEAVKESTLGSLLSSTYEVTDFNTLDEGLGYGHYEYVITTQSNSRAYNKTVTVMYGANVLDVDSCRVEVQKIAE